MKRAAIATPRSLRSLASIAVAILIVGCGGPRPPHPSPHGNATASLDGGAGDAGPADDVPSLDAIAARGASEAPLMREVLRVRDASKPIDLPASDRDACYRAAVAANRPVRARIEDASKTSRGDAAPAAMSVLVPPRGPACAKKGEILRLVVEGDPGTISRAVVWQAP